MRTSAIIAGLLLGLAGPVAAATASGDGAAATPATPTAAWPDIWTYRLAPSADGKVATLTIGPLTVDFAGEPLAATFGGSIQVNGGASGQDMVGDMRLCISESCLRVSFRGKSLALTRAGDGLRVRIGGTSKIHELPAAGRMAIRFARNGAATVISTKP